MTLRDYFASKAMIAICSMVASGMHDCKSNDEVAVQSYGMADAMLKARDA